MSEDNRTDEKWSFGRRTAIKLTGGVALGSASAGTAAAGGKKKKHWDDDDKKWKKHKDDGDDDEEVEGSLSLKNDCKKVCIDIKPDSWWTVEVTFKNGKSTTYTDDDDVCVSFYKSKDKKKALKIETATLYVGEDSTEGRELDSVECEDDGYYKKKHKKDGGDGDGDDGKKKKKKHKKDGGDDGDGGDGDDGKKKKHKKDGGDGGDGDDGKKKHKKHWKDDGDDGDDGKHGKHKHHGKKKHH